MSTCTNIFKMYASRAELVAKLRDTSGDAPKVVGSDAAHYGEQLLGPGPLPWPASFAQGVLQERQSLLPIPFVLFAEVIGVILQQQEICVPQFGDPLHTCS